MKERLARILKVFLGLLFIVSALLKIADMDKFELYIYSYHFFSLNVSFLVARAAIILELVLGIGLLCNCFHKLMWWGSVLMLLGYTGLLTYAVIQGRTDNCHCFGEVLQFNPWQSILKNLVLMGLFVLVYHVKGRRFKHDVLGLAGITVACCLVVFLVSRPDNFTSDYKASHELRGDRFEEALHQPPLDTLNLTEGKKVVGIFSSSCEICMMAAQKLSLMQQFYGFPEKDVLYLFMGNDESVQQFYQESQSISYPYVLFEDATRLLEINNGKFPLVILMKDGSIVHEYNFRNMKEEEIKAFFNS